MTRARFRALRARIGAFVRRCRQLHYPTTIGAVRVVRGQRT